MDEDHNDQPSTPPTPTSSTMPDANASAPPSLERLNDQIYEIDNFCPLFAQWYQAYSWQQYFEQHASELENADEDFKLRVTKTSNCVAMITNRLAQLNCPEEATASYLRLRREKERLEREKGEEDQGRRELKRKREDRDDGEEQDVEMEE